MKTKRDITEITEREIKEVMKLRYKGNIFMDKNEVIHIGDGKNNVFICKSDVAIINYLQSINIFL